MTPTEPEGHAPAERRASFRCPVNGPRRHARLRIGAQETSVTILDESAGGFAVEMTETPRCQAGDTLLLQVASAWVEVRVINVDSPEPAPSHADASETCTRLNLMRLRDVDEWEANPDRLPLLSWERFRSALVPLVPLGSSFKGTATMIVGIVAAGIVLVYVLENSVELFEAIRASASSDDAVSGHKEPFGLIARDSESRTPRRKTPKRDRPSQPPETKTSEVSEPPQTKTADTRPAAKQRVKVPPQAVRLAHPEFLLKPEVTKLLSLTRNQREKLREIIKEDSTASDAARLLKHGAAAGEDAVDSLTRLGNRGLKVLTNQQRRTLKELYTALQSMNKSGPTAEPAAPKDTPATPDASAAQPDDERAADGAETRSQPE